MIRLITCSIIFVALVFIAGCASYLIYPQIVSPQTVDIPLINKMGDLRIDVGGSFTGNNALRSSEAFDTEEWSVLPSVHGTISYGMSNRFALQMHANISSLSTYYFQTALGMYKGWEKKTVLELYGGYGYGSSIISNWAKNNTKYHLPFAQLNIGRTGLNFLNLDYGMGIKTGYIYAHIMNDAIAYSFLRDRSLLVEPCVFIRFGGRKVKFNMKASYLWTNCDVADDYYIFTPFQLSVGANFRF